jgi:hypothetical protein
MAMVIDRADSCVGIEPGGAPTAAAAASGWLKSLPENENEVRAIASDLVLRTLRVALEPGNITILRKLKEQPSSSFSDLVDAARLSRLSVHERVNDLIQAGLAVKDIQTGQVQGTKAADVLMTFVQQTEDELFSLIRARLKA